MKKTYEDIIKEKSESDLVFIENELKEIRLSLDNIENKINKSKENNTKNTNSNIGPVSINNYSRYMDVHKYKEAINSMISFCYDLLIGDKFEQYANSKDVFKSFNIASDLQDITPEQALIGMMSKHTASIKKMADDIFDKQIELVDIVNKDAVNAEKYKLGVWREKIGDSINYLLILYAMIYSRGIS